MTREEALENFQLYKNKKLNDYQTKFWNILQNKGEALKKIIFNSLEELSEKIKSAQKTDTVHFQFSLLRVDLLARKYTILLHAYNVDWYLDENPVWTKFDLSFLFKDLNNVWDELLLESKKYVGKVNRYDVNNMIYEEVMKENKLIAHILRFLLRDLEKEEVFRKIPKDTFWMMRWGEYRDQSEIILQVDRYPKKQEDLEETLKEEKEDALVYSYWYNGNFKEVCLAKRQLYFIGFENCEMQNLNFEEASLLGAKFKGCQLKNCNFKGAFLKHSDFRGTHFEEVDFEGADLTEAIFEESDIPYLHLHPKQLQMIYIERS